MSTASDPAPEEQPFHSTTILDPLKVGPFIRPCPVCRAPAGKWCTAVFTLPKGSLLRVAHDARR